jgi:lipopolysaccharide export system protein LptA
MIIRALSKASFIVKKRRIVLAGNARIKKGRILTSFACGMTLFTKTIRFKK